MSKNISEDIDKKIASIVRKELKNENYDDECWLKAFKKADGDEKKAIIYDINKNIDYLNNKLNETGKPVPENFEYRSDNNIHFLTVQEIIKINKGLLL